MKKIYGSLIVVLVMCFTSLVFAGDVFYGGLKLGSTLERYDVGDSAYLLANPYMGVHINKHIDIEANFERRYYDHNLTQSIEGDVSVDGVSSEKFRRRGRRHGRWQYVNVHSDGTFTGTVDTPELEYKGSLLLHIKF